MKKYSTADDLNELGVSIPLNKARNLLTLCKGAADDAIRVLVKAKALGVTLGPLQRAALEEYVADYKYLRDAICDTLEINVSALDQARIRAAQIAGTKELENELVAIYSERIQEAHDCPESNCTTCAAIRNKFNTQAIKNEFDLTDLPEGSIVVPGSEEEN